MFINLIDFKIHCGLFLIQQDSHCSCIVVNCLVPGIKFYSQHAQKYKTHTQKKLSISKDILKENYFSKNEFY